MSTVCQGKEVTCRTSTPVAGAGGLISRAPLLPGVGFGHFTGDVKKMLSKILSIDQDNYPEMLGHTCIINAGSVVSLLFRFIKPYLDIRTQNKIEVRAGSRGLQGLLLVGELRPTPVYNSSGSSWCQELLVILNKSEELLLR